jgi:DNA-binding SARP family transcriptional activator
VTVKNPKPPDDEEHQGRPTRPSSNGSGAQNNSATPRPGGPPGGAADSSGRWLHGDVDSLLQQALNALIHGDAHAAADAARIALARADGPDRKTHSGWAAWLLGLTHLYNADSNGAAPYLHRAQDLAVESGQPTLALAVYLAQQLSTGFLHQVEGRQLVARMAKQVEDQEVALTEQFQAMLKLAREAWPNIQAVPLPPSAGPGLGGEVSPPQSGFRPDALPPLQVQMLGPFRVAVGGREVSLRQSRKAADVFKYMLAHRVRPTTKEALVQTHWPDVEVRTATHRLQMAVSTLRKILNGGADDMPGYIIFSNDAYLFNPLAVIEVDVERFLEHLRQGQVLDRAGRASEAVQPYEHAVALYHDDYLIDNLYDDWTETPRSHLRERYLAVLTRLCEYYITAGRYDDCLQSARKILGKDNYREDAHRFVMISLYALGQRNQALLQYQICEQVLGADLGVPPTGQTVDLYQRIKNEGQSRGE